MFITYQNSLIHYTVFGNGKRIVFAFHGYGEDAESFSFLNAVIGNSYTIIAIDFPFHGKTIWNEPLTMNASNLLSILKKTHPIGDEKFSLLGYSMGGRVALQVLQAFPNKIEQVILIAPDGLHHNFWHWLSTQTSIGNKLFKLTMHYPKWLFTLMKTATTLHLFNKSIYNFVNHHLSDSEARLILYKRWTTMRKFKPNLLLLQDFITIYKIPVKLLFGKFDKIIVAKNGYRFQKNNEAFISVSELNAGHQILKEKYVTEIAAMFGC